MSDESRKIQDLAKYLSRTALAVAMLSVIGYAIAWGDTRLAYRMVSQNSFAELPAQLSTTQNILLFMIGALPTLVFILALLAARNFFDSYRNGHLFPEGASAQLKRIGKYCLALAILNPIIRTVSILIMTYTNPPGQKQLVLSLSSTDGFLLVFSGLLFMIGYILAEANRVAEDNKMIV